MPHRIAWRDGALASRHPHTPSRPARAEATDLQYAIASAAASGLTHHVIRISLPDLLRRYLPLVVRAIKSFDPMSLRNDVASECHPHGSLLSLHC